MYERIKSLLDSARNRYILIGSIVFLALLCAGYIFYQPSGADYHRAVDAVERIEREQRNSVDLNQELQSITDRSTELNQQATIRIERIEDYNQGAAENLERSQQEIDRAIRALERNRTIYNRIEERNQEQPGDGKTTP